MNRIGEDDEFEYFEEPGAALAAARALKRSGTMGWSDELQGALESRFPRLQLPLGDFFDPSVETPAAPTYEQARTSARAVDDATREANPGVSTAVEIGTAVLHPVNRLGGSGLAGAVRGGAAQGAAQGLGDSRADLTDADVLEYVKAFGDTAKGAGLGAGFGATGHGVGAGLRWVGRKGGELLDNARERLFREEAEAGIREAAERDAPLISIREREAAARAKEAARMEREHGRALEMNKGVDRRAAREAERAAAKAQRQGQRRSGAPELSEEPGTRTLRGYQGSAGERRAVNFDRVEKYRERLQDPGLPEAERVRLQRYVEKYGDAVDNPGAFERARIEQALRKRYPRDVVDRMMRERVGPDGQILPRRQSPAGDETAAMGFDDLQAQGFTADEVAERFGPGGSAWKGYTPRSEQPTQVIPLELTENPTRIGLIRTSPDTGFEGIAEHPMHTFEFRPRGSQESFEVVAFERTPGEVYVESVKPVRASSVEELHGEMANQFGAGSMKELSQELARAFPGARRITGQRMTGANVGHEVNLRAPEVTQAGVPDFPPEPTVRTRLSTQIVPLRDLAGEAPAPRAPVPDTAPPPTLDPLDYVDEPSMRAPLEETFEPVTVANFNPLGQLPARRAAGEGMAGFGGRLPAPAAAPPAGGRPPTNAARPSAMAPTPQVSAPNPSSLGRSGTLTPESISPGPNLSGVGAEVPPRSVPRYGDEDVATVYEYLQGLGVLESPAMQRAGAREAGALGQVAQVGYEGMRGAGNVLGGIAGAAVGITREALGNPAVRARALSLLRVRRLAEVDPAVFARVGRSLEAALAQGPDEYAAAVHVYNQTDPEFRAATRRAEEGMEALGDAELEQELRAAGLL